MTLLSARLATLRVRMFLLVLIAVLPAAALVMHAAYEQRSAARADAQRDALRLVKSLARDHDQLIHETRSLLSVLALIPQIHNPEPATCGALLAHLLSQNPSYSNLLVLTAQGDAVCSAVSLPGPTNYTDRVWFPRVLESRSFAVGDYVIGRATGKPLLGMAYPVIDADGRMTAILVAGLDLSWLNTFIAHADLPPQAAVLVLDRNGVVLARHPQAEPWLGKSWPETAIVRAMLSASEGTAETAGLDGVVRLHGFTSLRVGADDAVHVSVGVPAALAYAEANRGLSRNLLALTVIAAASIAAAWGLGDLYVSRPVRRLTSVATRLGAGDLGVRTGLPSWWGELGQLARAFDEMAGTLQQRESLLRQAEAQYRALVERIPAIIYTATLDAAVGTIYISPQVEPLLGFSPAEWTADPEMWVRQIHPDDRERVLAEYECAHRAGTPFISEYKLLTREGRVRWFRDEARLVRDAAGQNLLMQGIMVDISERKQAEEALKRYAVELERSNRELQDFAYISSHDLQEPLRKVVAFGDRLKTRHGDALDEQGRDDLERMRGAAARMQRLIDSLLTYSRVTTHAQPFAAVNLSTAAQEAVADLDALVERTGGRVDVAPLPTIDADPAQMYQLLQNLIGNALKFHGKAPPLVKVHGGPLSTQGLEPPDGSADPLCQIVVEDNGIGFNPKYLDRIFQPFQRLHGREEYEGIGMGLAICRKIVERHGGAITAHSASGQGARFIVTLPSKQRPSH